MPCMRRLTSPGKREHSDLGVRKMCLGKVYQAEESDESFLESIVYLRLEGDQVELETLFGEKRVIPREAARDRLREVEDNSAVVTVSSSEPAMQ